MNFTNLRSIFILFIILAACITGYLQTNRLSRISIVSGIGIDKEDENYIVSLQIYNPEANKKEASDEIGGYVFKEKGNTVAEALKKLEKDLPKTLFLGAVQIVVLGENLLRKEGVEPTLDFLIRAPSIPAHIQTVVIKDAAPELFFQFFIPNQHLSSLYIREMLSASKSRWGHFQNDSAERIKSLLEDHTTDFVMPYITIDGEIEKGLDKSNIEKFKPSTSLSLTGLAIFNKDKLQSFLTFDESNWFALLRGENQKINMTLPCAKDENYFTLNAIKTTSSLDTNTRPVSFDFKVRVKGNLEEINCKKDLTKPESIKEMEALIEKRISQKLKGLVEKQHSSKAEFLGLKDALFRQHPRFYRKNKNRLNTVLGDAQIHLDVNVTVDKVGQIEKISN